MRERPCMRNDLGLVRPCQYCVWLVSGEYCVDQSYPLWHVEFANVHACGEPGKTSRSGGVDPQRLVDDGLHVRQLT